MKGTTIATLGITVAIAFGVSASAQAQRPNPRGVNPSHYQCYRVSEQQPIHPQEIAHSPGLSGRPMRLRW